MIFALDRGDETYHLFDVSRRKHHSGKTSELLLDLADGQRMIRGAASLLDLGRQRAAVLA